MKNKKLMVLSAVIALVGILCIAGGAYAIFNYYKEGTIENIASTGKITFRYDETSINGINLQNALPILDKEGTALNGDGEYFDFSVSTDGTDKVLYYKIELAVTEDSTLPTDAVKVYLTKVVDGVETIVDDSISNGSVITYDKLIDNTDNTTKILASGYFDVTDTAIVENYRLRIWIDKNADFSPLKNEDGTYQTDENGNYIYPYNNKTFKVRVNVSATAGNTAYGSALGPLSCNETHCDRGTEVTLADGSNWVLLNDYNAGDETINLIYSEFIDQDGNYTDDDSLFGLSSPYQIYDYDVRHTILNTFVSKLRTTLADYSITASIPTPELMGFDFVNDDDDNYYLQEHWLHDREIVSYGDKFILEYKVPFGYNSYINETLLINDLVLQQVYPIIYEINGVGLKPVITVSKDYLEPYFEENDVSAYITFGGPEIGDSMPEQLVTDKINEFNLSDDIANIDLLNFNGATISIEKVDSFEDLDESTNIVKIPNVIGYNYYIVKVVSASGKYSAEYKVSIYIYEN